jgi:nicotinamidase-related amidase
VGRELAPYSAKDVLARAAELAAAVRAAGGTVVYVHVDLAKVARLPVDAPLMPPGVPVPADAGEIVPESGLEAGDVVITKRSWGAFYGTDLEEQLKRRGIKTIVIGGIATNMGVESTARGGFDRGYELVFVEDAMTTMSKEWHEFAVKNLFPRMGRVRSAQQVREALAA